MSAYNPAYNPASYLTDIYSQPVPGNPYALFYPGPPADQYIPCHWTPDSNQAFYAPSISQGIPLGWCHPPAFPANGSNPCMYPGEYSAAPLNPTYLFPTHYYAHPVPTAASAPPEHIDNYSPPHLPFSAQAPPSPKQQRFTRCTCTLLINLGYSNTPATPEVWADQLLDFHKCYLQGNLSETMQGTLSINASLQNELCTLVEEVHTSPNPCSFEDPLDPSHSFHVQHKEPIKMQSKALAPISCQQEELNMASSILRNFNPVGGLFNQPTTHTLALSACPQANSVPSTFQTWDQPAAPKPHSQWPSSCVNNDNWTLSYIDEPGNPTNKPALHNNPPWD
ncbi:hypothetical protein C0989_002672 [Termitomyces sp. Mn162]|nr:hypothetical protein C0989_002672 [Termitomyces sp. Mn162]